MLVRKTHVQDAVTFLDTLYKKQSFGYYATSREYIEDNRIAEKSREDVADYIMSYKGLARFLRQHNSFRLVDLQEMRNIQRDEAQAIIEYLSDARMVTKKQAQILVSPILNEIIRDIKD